MHPVETIPDVRDLRRDERDLIAWLLEHGEPEAVAYVSQLPDVTVVSHCSCGCPTIDLAVGARSRPPSLILFSLGLMRALSLFAAVTVAGSSHYVLVQGRVFPSDKLPPASIELAPNEPPLPPAPWQLPKPGDPLYNAKKET